MFRRKNLPPLPEGAHLLLSSPPPALPALLCTSFDLLPPFQRTTSPSNVYNTSWAQATLTGPSLPITVTSQVTGMQGYQLHHSQSHSILVTSGIILPSHTVPTSQQEPVLPITGPLPPSQLTIPASLSGISPYRTGSSHPSLYQSSWNQSPDHPIWSDLPGNRSMSDISHHDPPLPSDSMHPSNSAMPPTPTSSWSSTGDNGQATRATQPVRHSPRVSTSMGSTGRAPHPQSQRFNPSPRQLPRPPPMTLTDAIHLFRAVNMSQPPDVLLHADYYDLFNYFAYKLLFSLVWASTDTGINYFYLSSLHVPVNSILQREAGQYASLLYNDVHPEAPMRVLTPY